MEKPTHVDPVRRFYLTLNTIFILTHIAKIKLTLSVLVLTGISCILYVPSWLAV